jgi:hypothetical protein
MSGSLFLAEAIAEMRRYKVLAEKGLAQVSDADFFRQVDPESNSIAIILKHLAGNMRSRWTDFLTSDGEKPDRDRDGEFVTEGADERAALQKKWDEGWQLALSTLEGLGPADESKVVYIRAEAHTVVRAIERQLAHLAYHVGQIVFLAKHFSGTSWQTPTIPRNRARRSTRK